VSAYERTPDPGRMSDADIIEIDTVTVAEPTNDDGAGTDELQDQIEQTRANMGETIDEIQDRLDPRRIGEQVREATIGRAGDMVGEMTDTAREAGGGFLDTIRDNPVPAALAALGLGWLWLKRPSGDGGRRRYGGYEGYRDDGNRGRGYREYGDYRAGASGGGPAEAARRARGAAGEAADRVQGAAGQAADTVQGAAGQAAGAVQQAAGQVQDTAQQWGAQVQYGAQRARYGVQDALYESPLGVGAIALAVGVAVGLAAPSTDLEDRMLGEARDSAVQKAQDTAQETMHKVQHVAQQTAETTKETAKQEAQKEGLTSNKE
jgi:hypothetical protein